MFQMESTVHGKVNVLVTGGTGFFGHNLVKALLKEEERIDKIHVFARHAPPTEETLSEWKKTIFVGTSNPPVFYDALEGPLHCEPSIEQERIAWDVRDPQKKNAIFDSARVIFFAGDICDEDALEAAMQGCTYVFHACGDTRWWNAKNGEQRATNYFGTITCHAVAARLPCVKRFIYTSTIDVMGYDEHGVFSGDWDLLAEGIDNDDGNCPFRDIGYNYADTKYRAEYYLIVAYKSMSMSKQLFELQNTDVPYTGHYVETIIIRPGSMIGPWDVTNQYGRLFKEIKTNSVAGIPSGSTSVCHVDDVVQAHVKTAFSTVPMAFWEKNHLAIVCGGTTMTYKELFYAMRKPIQKRSGMSKTIGGCCGYEVIPKALLVAYGWGCELYADLWSGKHPEINPGMARYMSSKVYCDSSIAIDAGLYNACYNSRAEALERVEEAILESYNWYRVRGRF